MLARIWLTGKRWVCWLTCRHTCWAHLHQTARGLAAGVMLRGRLLHPGFLQIGDDDQEAVLRVQIGLCHAQHILAANGPDQGRIF
jgi:hypothetical protein